MKLIYALPVLFGLFVSFDCRAACDLSQEIKKDPVAVLQQVVDVLKVCGIVHARTVTSALSFAMPMDFLRWNPTCSHKNPNLENLKNEFLNLHKTQYLYMFYLWGHSYEFEIDNNWNVIENFAKDMSGKDDIWYATNIEIVDYLDAARRLLVSVNGDFAYNPSAKSVWLEVDKKAVEIKGGEQISL